MFRIVLLLTLLAFFGLYDFRYRKVDNKAVAVSAVCCLAAGSLTQGVATALWGMAAGFVLTLFIYLIGAIGAGDVKLFAALGALAGAGLITKILIFSILVGGAVGVVLIASSLAGGCGVRKALCRRVPFIPQCLAGAVLAIII